jgi:hypothetical protein
MVTTALDRPGCRRRAALVVCTLMLGGWAGQARAEDPYQAREVEAKKACLARHTERGIELLAELYAETNDPTYIYNQARCYQQGGKAQEALVSFREYLRKAHELPADEKAQVEAYISELEAQTRQASPAPALDLAAHQPAGSQSVDLVAHPGDESSAPPIYRRWWFWTGLGVLLAGTAAVVVAVASSGGGPTPYKGNFDPGTASVPSR